MQLNIAIKYFSQQIFETLPIAKQSIQSLTRWSFLKPGNLDFFNEN